MAAASELCLLALGPLRHVAVVEELATVILLRKGLSSSERRRMRDEPIIQNKLEMKNWNKFVFELLFTVKYTVPDLMVEDVQCCQG